MVFHSFIHLLTTHTITVSVEQNTTLSDECYNSQTKSHHSTHGTSKKKRINRQMQAKEVLLMSKLRHLHIVQVCVE